MSSPIHHDGDDNPVLRYAPPRARAQAQASQDASAPPPDQSWRRQSSDGTEFSGDRAIVEMRRRLALDPQWVPEPPQNAAPGRNLWIVALHTSGALGAAALVAWIVVSVPGITEFGRYVARMTFPGTLVSSNSRTTVPPSGMMSTIAGSSVATSSVATKTVAELPHRTVAVARTASAGSKTATRAARAVGARPIRRLSVRAAAGRAADTGCRAGAAGGDARRSRGGATEHS